MKSEWQEPLLKVEHLRQYFNKGTFHAVDDVSFDIAKGEVLGLVGESGCGKTTTGRSIIKLYPITGGNIYFKGKRINAGLYEYKKAIATAKAEARAQLTQAAHNSANARRIRRKCALAISEQKKLMAQARQIQRDHHFETKIQMIFQDPVSSLDPRMTVREIIAEGLRIHGERNEQRITQKVFHVLKTVGLVPEYADRYPHEFSGGQRQRIGIARAIIMEPELIIADEPVSALDVSVKAQVINLLNDLRKTMGLTILFIAHDLSVVKYFSDRIAVMYYGKLVELASSSELFLHPCHPYTKSLLSAIPLPDPGYEKQRVRIPYIHAEHNESQGELREVAPGHFVRCTNDECAVYRKQLVQA